MRKNLLALSIAAMVGGLSGVANAAVFDNALGAGAGAGTLAAPAAAARASALELSANGIGHILTVPYFTTQGANASLLNIVNTDQVNGKAVKLRYRGASNSDDIFDITVYLSPGDIWTANVSANGDVSALTTTDTSCTIPAAAAIRNAGGKFNTTRVLNNAAAETREGYIEILNTADIPPAGAGTLFAAIKHVNGVAPCTAAMMNDQAADLTAAAGANNPATRGYSWPTGGLMANWTIVNVGDKASFSGEAVAVRANVGAGGVSGAGNLVWFPQTNASVTFPAGDPSAVAVAGLTADPLLRLPGFAARVNNQDFPDLSTPYTTTGAGGFDAAAANTQANGLAGALATQHVTNEFLTAGPAQFATDWVLSMPTRRYAVALNYAAIPGFGRLISNALVNTHFAIGGATPNTALNAAGTRACVVPGATMAGFDHEENTSAGFSISPSPVLEFCGETTVLSWNSATGSKVLGSTLAWQNVNPTDGIGNSIASGWARVGLAGSTGVGLPVIGFAAAKAQGANLGGTWNHRTR